MVTSGQFFRNVVVNWLAMLMNMLVPFFLSPFTVHHLGLALYGVWVLVISSVVYFNLLDLGLRNAVVRFVAKAHASGDHDEAVRVASTAVWMRVAIGLLIFLLAALLAFVFPHIFSILPSLYLQVRLTVLLTALGIAMTLIFGITGAILSAIHRFDLISSVTTVRALVRAGGFVWLLSHGHGIVWLAGWELTVAVLVGVAQSCLCLREYPELRRGFGILHMETARKIWLYGSYASLITLAGAVLYYSDNVVVGAMLGVTTVTYYAIAGNLSASAREVVSALSSTFTPMASSLEAVGKNEQLRRLLVQGTRASLLVYLPIACVLAIRGQSFVNLWMGREYGQTAGVILKILILNHVLTTANVTSCGIAYGMGKHRPLVIWAIIEAVLNLALSVVLARQIGIYGVAWGTAIAGGICNLMFWPRYISRLVPIDPWEYIWSAWLPAFAAVIPFLLGCYWEEKHLAASSMVAFFMQVAAALPLMAVSAAVLFRNELGRYLRLRLRPADV
jgi:O-antigen/teichoic acid export membrane protein